MGCSNQEQDGDERGKDGTAWESLYHYYYYYYYSITKLLIYYYTIRVVIQLRFTLTHTVTGMSTVHMMRDV